MPDFETIHAFINQLDTGLIYLVIFAAGFFENCIPPIPGDTVTVLGAWLVGTGRLNYFGVFFSATAGNILGFLVMYHVGRYFGKDFFIRKNFRFFPKRDIEKAEAWFVRYGFKIILFNRFLSGLRSVISIFSGMAHLHRPRVILFAFISSCMWDGVLLYGGYVLGANFETLITRYNKFVFLMILTVIAVAVGVRWWIRKKTPGHDD